MIEIVCADPYGAAMWSWFTNGNLETNDGDSIAEGIGQGRVTKNIEGVKVDRAYRIPDQIGLTIVYQLLREEGLFLGLSSGINVAGAVRLAKESGPGQTIVTDPLRLGPQISINALQSRLAGFQSSRSRSSVGIDSQPLILNQNHVRTKLPKFGRRSPAAWTSMSAKRFFVRAQITPNTIPLTARTTIE